MFSGRVMELAVSGCRSSPMVIWTPNFVLGVTILLAWALFSRVAYVLASIWFGGPTAIRKGSSIKTLVVLGSGGHTSEMLKLVAGLDRARYHPQVFVIANTDKLSRDRLNGLSKQNITSNETPPSMAKNQGLAGNGGYELRSRKKFANEASDLDKQRPKREQAETEAIVEIIPRSREVGQSYVTSVFTTIFASLCALKIVVKHRPDLIIVNGPGSCVPVCMCGLLLRMLAICNARITFVESLCRVRSLSLTGKILYCCLS
ncbi:hypothetical protein HAZT_HAZT003091 [Hyalella azteca]|uniref:UDP-N-acetylglucosamine transferase subunit ALG14 n=1 Tax=Hyalella azteca TaxID=294128 RepID=A0A6A0GWD8_HYAAZ|nr:hypothetical protein HAZT_HAZT003091 [Hyalella azteca]